MRRVCPAVLALVLAVGCSPPPPPPPEQASCLDGQKNGTETAVDCGGPACPRCADGQACKVGTDCLKGNCAGQVCKGPTCVDGLRNGDETGLDCGATCPACPVGETCGANTDCQSSYCSSGVCTTLSCSDGVKNGTETDKDCGGAACPKCADAKRCAAATDCKSKVCTGTVCQAPSCQDTVLNGTEADVDCGAVCVGRPCALGKKCVAGADCVTLSCQANVCAAPSCTDLAKNQNETDVDCGGSCPKCADGLKCGGPGDCTSSLCTSGKCVIGSCADGTKNGGETDQDCGGAFCAPCAAGKVCVATTDCASGVCTGGTCRAPTCTDSTRNGAETDVDCGGGACPACADLLACVAVTDCVSRNCVGGFCRAATCLDGLKNGREQAVDCGGDCPPCGPDTACDAGTDCTSGLCSGGACDETTCEALSARWQLDEASGLNAVDALGFHAGALTAAGATRIAGKLDAGLAFSGAGHVAVPDGTPLDLGEADFSVSLWARLPAGNKNLGRLVSKGASGPTSGIGMGTGADGWAVVRWNGAQAVPAWTGTGSGKVPSGGVAFLLSHDGAGSWLYGTCGAKDDGAWHHYAFTLERLGGVSLYVDGALQSVACGDTTGGAAWFSSTVGRVDQLAATPIDSACDLCLGASCQTNATCGAVSEGLVGDLDDVALYGRALTAAEVARLWNGGASRTPCRNIAGVGHLWVADYEQQVVNCFPRLASGDRRPLIQVGGLNSQLKGPAGLAVTGSEVVVADRVASSVFRFNKTDDGNAAPKANPLGGAATGLNGPGHIALASELFVTNYGGATKVYSGSASGNSAPLRSLDLLTGNAVAVSSSELFLARHVDSADASRIAVYARGASGSTAPLRNLTGPSTELQFPAGLAVFGGELFVADADAHQITVFNLSDSGDTAPKRVIAGVNTALYRPLGLAVLGGEIYVANHNGQNVLVFGLADFGDVAPRRFLQGAGSTLFGPIAIVAE